MAAATRSHRTTTTTSHIPVPRKNSSQGVSSTLQAQITALETELSSLKAENSSLKSSVEQLQPLSLEKRLQPYFQLLENHASVLGPNGDSTQGEIQILTDLETIRKIEESTGQKVGILAENHWQIWICDAVRFPNGKEGVYGRFVWKNTLNNNGFSGAAILPYTPDGKILLMAIYRHATRQWELELPRGCSSPDELAKKTVIRELQEETGAIADDISPLGTTCADTGCLIGLNLLAMVKVQSYGPTQQDPAETGSRLYTFTERELQKIIKNGEVELTLHDSKKQKVFCRDPFLLSALYLKQLGEKPPENKSCLTRVATKIYHLFFGDSKDVLPS